MVPFSPEQEQSEFNQGIATLMRIHSCLLELIIASTENNYVRHYELLRVLYKELRPMMNDTERKEFNEYGKDMERAHTELRLALGRGHKTINKNIIDRFDHFELELRDIIQKHHMGLPQKKDSRYALSSK